ncbi:hypothetical protein RDI58_026954 [Solanum bulbocastanum]|uniref:Uncharacterized protein n=1 Tax=Solanum bulbocastanum TaxID=147425 RepID=A0AAN8SUI4_SOLBU
MSSIASDSYDYDMGDYDCDDKGMYLRTMVIMGAMMIAMIKSRIRMGATISEGEYEKNLKHDSYGEDREEEDSCGSSYDDERACERSYSHSESEDGSYDEPRTCYTSLLPG